jgi:hypothetical protein
MTKSCTRTSSGEPYLRPVLRKSPTSSFFLVSTGDYRLAHRERCFHPIIEVVELREVRRRSAVEPVIGHLKIIVWSNYLHHRDGDANNAILTAVGYNFRLLIKWLRILLCLILVAILAPPKSATA